MPVTSIGEYEFEPLDKLENFHGNQLTYLNWEEHLLFCAPLCFPFPPDMPFGALVAEVLPAAYGQHPEFKKIKWDEVIWKLDGKEFTPNMEASLADNGFGHKSLLRFWTPGLTGIKGSYA